MADDMSPETTNQSTSVRNSAADDDVAQSAGAGAAAIDANPLESLEEARRAAAGEAPNASGGPAPSDTEMHIPSSSDPCATDIPSANMPSP